MLPHLSFDIQVGIIKKLPIKSLIQFRSVCKAWKSLIDSSQFIAGYNDRHDLPQHLVVRYKVKHGEEIEVKYVSFVDDNAFPQQMFALTIPPLVQAKAIATTILGSSHGLLFLADYYGQDPTSVVIWNPAIRKSIAVALPNLVDKRFDFVVGVGVCPNNKDPKLAKVTYIRGLREGESISCIPCQVMVFTLSSGEWTSICSSNLPRRSIEFTWFQTVVGQFIYWIVSDWIAEDGEFRFHDLIISFDMSTEEFREIDLPDELREGDLFVFRLRESLAVVEYSEEGNGTDSWKRVCAVWMMEHGNFIKLNTINLPNASILRTIEFRKSGEPIIEMCDDYRDYDSPGALVVYEPCSEHIKDLGICVSKHSFFGSLYMESLLLLDHDDGHIYEEVTFGTGN